MQYDNIDKECVYNNSIILTKSEYSRSLPSRVIATPVSSAYISKQTLLPMRIITTITIPTTCLSNQRIDVPQIAGQLVTHITPHLTENTSASTMVDQEVRHVWRYIAQQIVISLFKHSCDRAQHGIALLQPAKVEIGSYFSTAGGL